MQEKADLSCWMKLGMMNIQMGDGDTFRSQKGKVSALPEENNTKTFCSGWFESTKN